MDLKTPSFSLRHNGVSALPLPPPPPPPPPGATHLHHRPYFFYWGKEAQFLFHDWPDNNSGMYALALILVFVFALLVELLANLHFVNKPGLSRVKGILFQSWICAIRVGFGYMVTLAVTSYNGGTFIAAVLGHAVGSVIFGIGLSKKEAKPN